MARRLTRDTRRAVLGGVAAGLADYFDIDPVLLRVAFVLLVFANGVGLIVYLVCWLIVPRRDAGIGAPAGASTDPAAAPGAPAPAERIVDEVRSAGEKAVGGVQRSLEGAGRGRLVAGTILIVLGFLFLLDRFAWLHWPHWARLGDLWPLLLIGLGGALILGARRAGPS